MPGTDEIPTVLAAAVRRALRAPSVYNTQPWWRLASESAELYADLERELGVVEPVGRLMVASRGVAPHHARVSLAVAGLNVAVDRLPDPTWPALMARPRMTGAGPADDGAHLLVVGDRGAGPAARALLGSVSHGAVDRVCCPVAIAHTDQDSR